MKNLIKQMPVMGFCILFLCLGAHAQTKAKTSDKKQGDSVAVAVLNGAGKVGVVVIGSAAKVACGTTKFIAKDVAVPVATEVLKPVALKAVPAMAKFAIQNSAKYLLPLALKLSVL